jgi:TonB-dependent starch-binding outer membrane protein SusC
MKLKLLHQAYTVTKYSCYGILLQCILYSMLIAEGSHAQKVSWEDVYVTVDMENITVEDALSEIENITDFTFAYPQSIVRDDKRFSLDVKDESLASLLRQISQETKLSFRRVNNIIHVRKRKQENPLVEELVAFDKLISGKVSDEKGDGLPGVNILIKNTATGTITDIDGNYRLNVPDDATILVFSYVGFLTEEVTIGDQTTIDVTLAPDIY